MTIRDPEYDPSTGDYYIEHDWTGVGGLDCTIVRAVAALTDTKPDSLPTLNEVIDPDAVKMLFRGKHEVGGSSDHVTFTYATYEITISRNGRIRLRPEERGDASAGLP